MRMVTKVYDLTRTLKESYESIINKNRGSEVYELYSSFLEDILGDQEQANIVRHKKIQANDIENVGGGLQINIYSDTIGALLISGNSDSFGRIAYLNDQIAQHLKITNQEAIDTSFSQFIPWPYNIDHDILMKNFIKDCTHPIIQVPKTFFLQNYAGYLFECNLNTKLLTVNQQAFFLVTIKPFSYTRQIILISEYGEILSFSFMVPFLVNHDRKVFMKKGQILDFFPSFFEFVENEPVFAQINGRDLAVIYQKKQFKDTVLHNLLLFHDEHEIYLLKQNFSLKRLYSVLNINNYDDPKTLVNMPDSKYPENQAKSIVQVSSSILSKTSKLKIDETMGSTNKDKSVISIRKKSMIYKGISDKFMTSTNRGIKIFMHILLFSVKFI